MVLRYWLATLLVSILVKENHGNYTRIFGSARAGGSGWGYTNTNGPHTWATNFPKECNEKEQSPINIVERSAVRDTSLPRIRWRTRADLKQQRFVVKNTGYTVQLEFKDPENSPVLEGGPLLSKYILAQIHFHWDSEHTLEGQLFGFEAHAVHYNARYRTIGRALEYPDGLAVVGYFVKVGATNRDMEPLVQALCKIPNQGDEYDLKPGALNWFWKADLFSEYFTYLGSLTTPPCLEIVTWIVAKKHGFMGRNQLAEFKKLNGPDGLMDKNFRPPQPLNDRYVVHYP